MKRSPRLSPDFVASLLLIAIWGLFFWRLFTPNPADRRMLIEGDFSGQFYMFGAYQYDRMSAGEIPLWNPYNNGGLPFIADTQAAVFYPPRLLTIALCSLTGTGWTYNALQMEMTAHVLLYSLLMYALLRRLTLGTSGTFFGAFAGSVIAAYSGFMSGYPPLQLALLEAASWLPLALVGITEATRTHRLAWGWLWLAGAALGLSWLAGHPQTSFYSTYLLVVYLIFRVVMRGGGWKQCALGIALLGTITIGLAAVLLLPGVEYLGQTARVGLSFDEKGNGFPFQDIAQFLLPGSVSLYSPLYVGVGGLLLAAAGWISSVRERMFWGGVAVISLGLSFGANSALFHAAYQLLPGFSFFRGQERAAFLVSVSLAVLAGYGLAELPTLAEISQNRLRHAATLVFLTCLLIAAVLVIGWLGGVMSFASLASAAVFSFLVAGLMRWLLGIPVTSVHRWVLAAICALVVYELFSVNIDNQNYQPAATISFTADTLVQHIQADTTGVFRVDGENFALPGNAGSLVQLQDMRGISPLFLDGPHGIIERELPSERDWELFAVRYVLARTETIPSDSTIVLQQDFRGSTVFLHRLANPRPFARLMYAAEVVDSDAFARALLADPAFDPRITLILHRPPQLVLPTVPPSQAEVSITRFAPEHISMTINTPENALLSVALVDYAGWQAFIDGRPAERLRAYGALTALEIPAGVSRVEFIYDPMSFRVGAFISGITGTLTMIVMIGSLYRTRRK